MSRQNKDCGHDHFIYVKQSCFWYQPSPGGGSMFTETGADQPQHS